MARIPSGAAARNFPQPGTWRPHRGATTDAGDNVLYHSLLGLSSGERFSGATRSKWAFPVELPIWRLRLPQRCLWYTTTAYNCYLPCLETGPWSSFLRRETIWITTGLRADAQASRQISHMLWLVGFQGDVSGGILMALGWCIN